MIQLLRRHHEPIGLDLGADCIKMVQLDPSAGAMCVTAASQYFFPADVPFESPLRRGLAVQAVRQMLRTGGFRGRQVVSAVADPDMLVKTIRVPEGNPQQIEQSVAEEAAKRVPFDLAAAALEYMDVGRVQQGNETCREIILLAVQNRDIDDEIALLSDMGLEPVAIDAGPAALFRGCQRLLLRDEDVAEVTLLVDIGATATKVVVGHGPELVFIKTINAGGREISQAVAKSLDLSPREAANLRESLARGTSPVPAESPDAQPADAETLSQEVLRACEPVLSQLAREISLCLRYHAVTFRGFRPAVMQVSGGEAQHPLTLQYLSRALAIKVVKADPFKHMNTSRVDIGQSRRLPAPCWMLATGLALRGVVCPAGKEAVA